MAEAPTFRSLLLDWIWIWPLDLDLDFDFRFFADLFKEIDDNVIFGLLRERT